MTSTQPSTPSLTVLHLAGSSETRFYFECSFLYAKAACRFADKGVKNYYAMSLPPAAACPGAGRFALLEDEVPSELLATDLMDLNYMKNPELSKKVTLLSKDEFIGALRGENTYTFAHAIQLVVPHMYDNVGLTTWRTFMSDTLHLPVVGPPGSANVLAQDKAACRGVLKKLVMATADGKRHIVPSGFVVTRQKLVNADGCVSDAVATQLMARVRAEAGGFPVMLKAPLEDNSRGVRLLGRQCLPGQSALEPSCVGAREALDANLAKELKEKVLEMLSYGDTVLFEQFVHGREFRFGVVELQHPRGQDAYRYSAAAQTTVDVGMNAAQVHGIPTMLEYLMVNPSMPIRTAADKLTTDTRGQMAQTKCSRRLVSCDPRVHAKANPQSGVIESKVDSNGVDQTVHPVSDKLQRRIEAMVRAAHKALGCRSYSLFDIRVDALSGQPFIIECCAFWSFSPISILTLMLESSGIDYKRVILDLWREHALSTTAAEERMCLLSKAPQSPPPAGISMVVDKQC